MDRAEGLSMLLEVLYCRFKCPPTTVVYDNACRTATYCCSREPHFFRNTCFVVDRLHFMGHTNCSPVFDARNYPHLTGINTQLAEQLFSQFNFSLGSLAYMQQQNFIHVFGEGLSLM